MMTCLNNSGFQKKAMKTQVKDLQFPKYFLLHELNIDPHLSKELLEVTIDISNMGEPDTVTRKGSTLVISQPSSITKFLYNVLYHLISDHTKGEIYQDKLSLGLLYACRDYVYNDFRPNCLGKPPLLMSYNKLGVPSVIMDEILGPLFGKKTFPSVMFIDCNFLDACNVAEDAQHFSKAHKCPHRSVSFHEYPFLVANSSIHNKAAQSAHITIKTMEMFFGEEKASKIVKDLLLSEDSNLIQYLLLTIKILEGDPAFVIDFLKYFGSNAKLTEDEENTAMDIRISFIQSDKYFNEKIKTAQHAKYTPQVSKQWHQWSMIQGLIEKQLAPMRGSMWPASETIKPIEDEHRQMEAERAKKKGKTQLNFEELLELAREWYNHKAVKPGQLSETLLKDNRVWK